MLFRPCGKPDGTGRRNAFNAGPVLHQPEDFIPGQHHVTMKHPHDADGGIGGPRRNGQYRTTGPVTFPSMENNPGNVYVSGPTASITLFYPSSRNASRDRQERSNPVHEPAEGGFLHSPETVTAWTAPQTTRQTPHTRPPAPRRRNTGRACIHRPVPPF